VQNNNTTFEALQLRVFQCYCYNRAFKRNKLVSDILTAREQVGAVAVTRITITGDSMLGNIHHGDDGELHPFDGFRQEIEHKREDHALPSQHLKGNNSDFWSS
jgi:hypothetical protein